MSDFWNRVDEELEYKGLNRAFLARECNFSVTNIGQGIKLGSTPSADTAVKIASVLGVSVEYLVTGENKTTKQNQENEQAQLRLYRKYHELIEKCEKLPQNQVEFLGLVADRLEKN
ncbi:MAG: helix-turn-helix domain-containing protein [Treponemataceae bacterium]|nr:helix-turn-helix domain-containing protein [Treponemataceae bacterium]